MNKKGAFTIRQVVIALVVIVVLFVLAFGPGGLLKGGLGSLLDKTDDIVLPGQAGETQRPQAPEEILAVFDNLYQAFQELENSEKTQCIGAYKQIPDLQGFTIRIESLNNEDTIFKLFNKKRQQIESQVLKGLQPCIIGGEAPIQSTNCAVETGKVVVGYGPASTFPAENFYRNWIDPGNFQDRKARPDRYLCKPEYTTGNIAITDSEEIMVGKEEYSLEDLDLTYNSDLINLLYVPEKGKACFILTNWVADYDEDGIDNDFLVQFNKNFKNDGGNTPGSTPIPPCT